MLGLFVISVVLSTVVYFSTWKLGRRGLRVMLALAVFAIVFVLPIIFVAWLGDPALPGSRTVSPEEIERAAKP